MTPAKANRGPGRPRDARADRQIVEAAQAILAADGLHGFSVDQVAERAGVARATVYRRYEGRDDLIIAAIEDLYSAMTIVDTGDVEADITAAVRGAVTLMTKTTAGQILPQIAGELARRSPFGQAYLDAVMGPRLETLQAILRRGIADGALRPDLDVEVAAASMVGTLMFLAFTGQASTIDDELPDRLVGQLLDGWRA